MDPPKKLVQCKKPPMANPPGGPRKRPHPEEDVEHPMVPTTPPPGPSLFPLPPRDPLQPTKNVLLFVKLPGGGFQRIKVENVPASINLGPVGSNSSLPPGAVFAFPFPQSSLGQGMPSPSPGGINVPGQVPQHQNCANSPGSQAMMNRPPGPGVSGGVLSPFSNQMTNVPSPSINLSTPMSMAPTPSPSPPNPEDQACFEKIKELRKYAEVLQRKIAKIGNKDMEKVDKMKKLLEILTNPNQQERVPMEMLLKCEVALKRMERHDTGGGVPGPSSVSVPTPQPSVSVPTPQPSVSVPTPQPSVSVPTPQPIEETDPFQQLQDEVMACLKNPTSSHTLMRTFRQPVEALTGQPFATSLDPFESVSDSNSNNLDIPGVLRRELKIIDDCFKVKVIRNPGSARSLVIHVSLIEPLLPRVPPLKIFIPKGYPDEKPSLLDLDTEYGSAGFLASVARSLQSRILNLPQRFTVLQMLSCWELSVRQVSNPNYKAKSENETREKISDDLARSMLSAFPF